MGGGLNRPAKMVNAAPGCRLWRRPANVAMPSLLRLLVVVGLLGGLAYAGLVSLATLVTPKQREMTVNIPPDKFLKNR
jgi:hypothetical protein